MGIYFYGLSENNSLKDIYVNLWQMNISIQYFNTFCTSIQENWYATVILLIGFVIIFLGFVKFSFLKLLKFINFNAKKLQVKSGDLEKFFSSNKYKFVRFLGIIFCFFYLKVKNGPVNICSDGKFQQITVPLDQ